MAILESLVVGLAGLLYVVIAGFLLTLGPHASHWIHQRISAETPGDAPPRHRDAETHTAPRPRVHVMDASAPAGIAAAADLEGHSYRLHPSADVRLQTAGPSQSERN